MLSFIVESWKLYSEINGKSRGEWASEGKNKCISDVILRRLSRTGSIGTAVHNSSGDGDGKQGGSAGGISYKRQAASTLAGIIYVSHFTSTYVSFALQPYVSEICDQLRGDIFQKFIQR